MARNAFIAMPLDERVAMTEKLRDIFCSMPDGWGSEKEALMRAYQQMAFTENKMMLILDIVAQYNHMTLWDYHAESDIMGRPNGIVRVGLKDNKTEQFYRVIVHMTSEWIIERMDSPIEVTEDNLLYTI